MSRNYVVQRRSPDWTTFDLEDTRAFCRDINIPETTVIDFARHWDATFPVGYLAYRQAMKQISLDCAFSVQDARVVSHLDLDALAVEDGDLLYFTDDDDWVQPGLFRLLRAGDTSRDGWLWNSTSVASRYDAATDTHSGGIFVRPVGTTVSTNNYAVSGSAWNRLGRSQLLEHYWALDAFEAGRFQPTQSDLSPSCSNKHLCATTFIARGLRGDARPDDLRAALSAMTGDLARLELPPPLAWLATPLAALISTNERVLATRV